MYKYAEAHIGEWTLKNCSMTEIGVFYRNGVKWQKELGVIQSVRVSERDWSINILF